MHEGITGVEFFDPFAEDGDQRFDPLATMEIITARYIADEVKHDSSADKFVADTQALIMDAQFVGKYNEAIQIAEMAHIICGENHAVQQSLKRNESAHDTINGLVHEHQENKAQQHDSANKDKSTTKNGKKKRLDWFRLTWV